MKKCGQKMKVTLPINGRESTFSEQEPIDVLEKHFSNESTEQVTTEKVAQKPTEGQWFEVNPQDIDQTLFREEREDVSQEKTRKRILEAFAEIKSNPEKYGKNFKTMILKKTWLYKTVEELMQLACEWGDHNVDWVEQYLEWAQRISNGESWKAVCNYADTANWYRLVIWKNGYGRLVGGASSINSDFPASDIDKNDCDPDFVCGLTVPSVAKYEK